MLTEVHGRAAAKAAPLLAGLDHQLSVAAVLAGTMPGVVLVDDAADPRAVFVHSPEGNFVGGDPTGTPFVADLRAHVAATFDPERDGGLVLSFDHDGWGRWAREIVPGPAPVVVPRRHYLLHPGPSRPRPDPPAGYRLVPIDAELLCRPGLPDHVRRWIAGNWGGEEAFLAQGFGVVARLGDDFAGWSVADCAVGDRAEIGIHTAPAHRRRGLASQVAAAAATIAFDRGLSEVGWHCNEDNPGSWHTAESAGFTLRRRYRFFVYSAGHS
ncbi:GNAT family N-acetyltransferase [Microlunatus speluncae]|uniref:GNAT family N-acetyltransferase n=1 Tax=Microlunatus speluncae TaxID=2594267 RepID=UPI00137649E7|nr:GNAT family N-acetyltransferase [Microlunatus speluncae]